MGVNPSQELVRLLSICERIELAHARLYALLAELHAVHPELAQLWRKTAREEEGHAAQFKLALSGAGGVVLTTLPTDEALHLLDAVEKLIPWWKSQPPTVPDALRTAIQMEEALARVHMNEVALFEREANRKLFSAMMASDQGHVDSLRDALSKWERVNGTAPEGQGGQ